tara:strand:- start:57 stop:419 length:363 start_codon:yes stop_codon:yes gene_type:complete
MSDMDREIALLEKQARIASSPKVKRVKAITAKMKREKAERERKKLRAREDRAYKVVRDKKVRAAGKASGMQTRAELKREGYTLTKHGYERKSMLPRVKRDWPGGRDDRTGKRRYSWAKNK